MQGNKQADLDTLNSMCASKEGKEKLLAQNAGFKTAIISAIAGKNKLDYPMGSHNQMERDFQTQKIKYLLEAIEEENPSLGSVGFVKSGAAGLNSMTTWASNIGRGVGRMGTEPTQYLKDSQKNAMNMFKTQDSYLDSAKKGFSTGLDRSKRAFGWKGGKRKMKKTRRRYNDKRKNN